MWAGISAYTPAGILNQPVIGGAVQITDTLAGMYVPLEIGWACDITSALANVPHQFIVCGASANGLGGLKHKVPKQCTWTMCFTLFSRGEVQVCSVELTATASVYAMSIAMSTPTAARVLIFILPREYSFSRLVWSIVFLAVPWDSFVVWYWTTLHFFFYTCTLYADIGRICLCLTSSVCDLTLVSSFDVV